MNQKKYIELISKNYKEVLNRILEYNRFIYTIKTNGTQIQIISLNKTAAPQELKNEPIPIGETGMGRYGKKYLVLSNGDNKAIPSPPFVKASKIP